MPTFDETFYLNEYPDVADAVARGEFRSGEEHFQMFGQGEGRLLAPPRVDGFDETFYLNEYPDVADAVARGEFRSGEEHFQMFGRAEGRLAVPPGNPPPPLNNEIDSLRNFQQIADVVGNGFTIEFSDNALVLKDTDAGGEGEFDNNPSGDNVIAYAEGGSIGLTVNTTLSEVAGGVLSFFYSSPNISHQVRVLDENGSLLRQGLQEEELEVEPVELEETEGGQDEFTDWEEVAIAFSGVVDRIELGSEATEIGFDDFDLNLNRRPNADDDNAETLAGVPIAINVLENDTDPDGDRVLLRDADPISANGGNVTVSGEGVIYTPATDFTGTDSFIYSITDDRPGGIDTATVTVRVNADNQRPIASDDTTETTKNIPVTIDVLGGDTDPDGDTLSISGVSSPSFGIASISGDRVIYTPNSGVTGTDRFIYSISDGELTATATVTVNTINQSPIAEDNAVTTLEDRSVAIAVSSEETDPDGDPLSVTAGNGVNGTVTVSGQELIYTPEANFAGTDSFTYSISDGDLTSTATVTVTIDAVNDEPAASDDTATTSEDSEVAIDLLSNDEDIEDDELEVTLGDPENGSVSISDEEIIYVPDADFFGTDSFSYSISDGQGGTAFATVTVTIDAVNDEPVAGDDSAITSEDSEVA
ncbi:MAG: Ig-like domain-containing protein, partial [Hormoscilla sp.]